MEQIELETDSKFVRLAAVAGVLAPVSYTAAYLIGGAIKPGYNPLVQYVSEIGVGGDAASVVMNFGGFLLCGLFYILFAFGLSRRMKVNDLMGEIVPVLVGISGGGFVATAFFPMDVRLHALTSFFASFIQVAPLFGIYVLWKDDRWKNLWIFSLVVAVITISISVPFDYVLPTLPGLHQRLVFLPVFAWIVVVAFRLFRLADDANSKL